MRLKNSSHPLSILSQSSLCIFILSTFITFNIQSLFAFSNNIPQYYPLEYQNLLAVPGNAQSSPDLKLQLYTLLTTPHERADSLEADVLTNSCKRGTECIRHIEYTYTEARQYLFGYLHLEKDESGQYFIDDVYCSIRFNKRTPGIGSIGKMSIPNDRLLNCEHTWPQSKFSKSFPSSLQKSDLHHLFPSQNKANSTRGNYPFADVKTEKLEELCNASRFGRPSPITIHSESRNTMEGSSFFEPPAEHKGNVARAIFYFSTRYKMKVSPIQEAFLRKWHKEDPVDAKELWRNEEIEKIQGTRNPYIDFPNIVDQIQDF